MKSIQYQNRPTDRSIDLWTDRFDRPTRLSIDGVRHTRRHTGVHAPYHTHRSQLKAALARRGSDRVEPAGDPTSTIPPPAARPPPGAAVVTSTGCPISTLTIVPTLRSTNPTDRPRMVGDPTTLLAHRPDTCSRTQPGGTTHSSPCVQVHLFPDRSAVASTRDLIDRSVREARHRSHSWQAPHVG